MLQVTLQPGSDTADKLVHLPQAAMEALIDSDSLKVASENSVVEALMRWKNFGGRWETLADVDKQMLVSKIRLCSCTQWFLTGWLMNEESFIYKFLTVPQRAMVLATVGRPDYWRKFKEADERRLVEQVFGGADSLPEVCWWKEPRQASSMGVAEMEVQTTIGELWSAEGGVRSKGVYFKGLEWHIGVEFTDVESAREQEGVAQCKLGLFMSYLNNAHCGPIVFKGFVMLEGPDSEATLGEEEFKAHDFGFSGSYGFLALGGYTFSSMVEASNKLQKFIHPDGKLHFQGMVSVVK